MGEVLSFKKNKTAPGMKTKPAKAKSGTKSPANEKTPQSKSTQPLSATKRPAKKKETMNAESIKLWWISQEFDELIRKAVLEKHIPVEELSAVMAHRLGSLLMVSERTPELTLFCMKIISKITNQPKPGSNAS